MLQRQIIMINRYIITTKTITNLNIVKSPEVLIAMEDIKSKVERMKYKLAIMKEGV